MTELSVLTWNIFWGLGWPNGRIDHAKLAAQYIRPKHNDPKKLAHTIRGFDPDIVALQEIDRGSRRNNGVDQVDAISKAASLRHVAYSSERSLPLVDDGNAILSKHRIPTQQYGTLPYTVERRNYILAFPNIGKKVAFINTHLQAHRFMKAERIAQAAHLAEVVRGLDCPIVLMGDLNCNPESEELRPLREMGLSPLNYRSTYPSYRPKHAYDNIIISGDIIEIFSTVLPDKRSDHLAFFARLSI